MKIKLTALAACFAFIAGCGEEKNDGTLSAAVYTPSHVTVQPMTFPSTNPIFKRGNEYKNPKKPEPYSQPNNWTIYMASPGWTDSGFPIVERLAADAAHINNLRQTLIVNGLADKVKVAWIQYDENPSPLYLESLDKVPDNFIPLYLKLHGPRVDFYIHSPAQRMNATKTSMRYDQWLMPYYRYAEKKPDGTYHTTNQFMSDRGINDYKSKFWDSWSRHWFVVNPEGMVVDAYLSNLGTRFTHGYDKPLGSLIHHLGLDPDDLELKRVMPYNYESYYSAPFWNKLDTELREGLNLQ